MHKKINRNTHRIFYHYSDIVSVDQIEKKGHFIHTFSGESYINLGNGYAIRKLKVFSTHLEYDTPLSDVVVPIAKIYDNIRFVNNFEGRRLYGRKHKLEPLVTISVLRKDKQSQLAK
ncbi:hypothetical protein [Nosocomiicoccus massiliensis]|uniref:hypothetical protein n=1 Tax=Nosocomiicoccus massiliensis TaxID=1232430 RepID=UPI000594A638|nr:hypothetical protein [Nosocomiicoccus massiliensis]